MEQTNRDPEGFEGDNPLAESADSLDATQEALLAKLSDPTGIPGMLAIAKLTAMSGHYESAARMYRRVLLLDPNNAAAFGGLGNALFELDDLPGAMAATHEALELDPDSVVALRQLGVVLVESGEYAEAIPYLEQVLERKPDDELARVLLGRALVADGRSSEAITLWQETLRQYEDSPIGHHELGEVLRAAGEFAGALEHLREAVRLDPSNPEYRMHVAHALCESGQIEQGIKAYRDTIKRYPDDQVRLEFARQLDKMGMHDMADREWQGLTLSDDRDIVVEAMVRTASRPNG